MGNFYLNEPEMLTIDEIYAKCEENGINLWSETSCRRDGRNDTIVHSITDFTAIMVQNKKQSAYMYADYYDYDKYCVTDAMISRVVDDFVKEDRREAIIEYITPIIQERNEQLKTIPRFVKIYADKLNHIYTRTEEWYGFYDSETFLKYTVLSAVYNLDNECSYDDDVIDDDVLIDCEEELENER